MSRNKTTPIPSLKTRLLERGQHAHRIGGGEDRRQKQGVSERVDRRVAQKQVDCPPQEDDREQESGDRQEEDRQGVSLEDLQVHVQAPLEEEGGQEDQEDQIDA